MIDLFESETLTLVPRKEKILQFLLEEFLVILLLDIYNICNQNRTYVTEINSFLQKRSMRQLQMDCY